jgi:hypothetical protein
MIKVLIEENKDQYMRWQWDYLTIIYQVICEIIFLINKMTKTLMIRSQIQY